MSKPSLESRAGLTAALLASLAEQRAKALSNGSHMEIRDAQLDAIAELGELVRELAAFLNA